MLNKNNIWDVLTEWKENKQEHIGNVYKNGLKKKKANVPCQIVAD